MHGHLDRRSGKAVEAAYQPSTKAAHAADRNSSWDVLGAERCGIQNDDSPDFGGVPPCPSESDRPSPIMHNEVYRLGGKRLHESLQIPNPRA